MEAAAASAEDLGTNDSAANTVSDAVRDATAAATEHAAKFKEAVSGAVPVVKEALAKLPYNSAYYCSYGVTYAAVFLAKTLPSENAVMRGFADGARAAMDALETK